MLGGDMKRTGRGTAALGIIITCIAACLGVRADETGVSFWVPGQYGSFAAVPLSPGWSLPVIYYHSSASASGSEKFNYDGTLAARIEADAGLLLVAPTYAFSGAVLGGQLALGVTGIVSNSAARGGLLLTDAGGQSLEAREADATVGFGDLYPTAALRWNSGNDNYMLYAMGDIPVGDYSAGRLANIGINHAALDLGGGYTWYDQHAGYEVSAVAGLTYNFENPATDYKNGIDFHLDWGASKMLSETSFIGPVGYVYQQLTGDSGKGATLGKFESRVLSIGPQVGLFLPTGNGTAFFNLKGYYEFEAKNRPEGWNVWAILSVPLSTPPLAHSK